MMQSLVLIGLFTGWLFWPFSVLASRGEQCRCPSARWRQRPIASAQGSVTQKFPSIHRRMFLSKVAAKAMVQVWQSGSPSAPFLSLRWKSRDWAQGFAFIDDTDVVEAAKTVDQSGEDVCPAVQQAAATLWPGGILDTGGTVSPDKLFGWLIDFFWNSQNGYWRFRRTSSMAPDFPMGIQGLTGEYEELT